MTELIINSQIQSINASKKFGDNNINFNFQKDGNREEIDGWKWYDEEPLEYTVFKIKQNADKTFLQEYEKNN